MNRPTHIAFLGFGEAARAFCGSLSETCSNLKFSAWDIKLQRDEANGMRQAMEFAGVGVSPNLYHLASADWIISAVTADQSLIAVEPLIPYLQGGLLIDINSVSPERKRQTAERISERDTAYLDMAVMTPVHPRGHRSPVLIAGKTAQKLLPILLEMGFSANLESDAPGAATAIKMVRSLFVKGLEAITIETLLAAEASGCFDEILASLSASYPGLNWPNFATYQFERTTTHGGRRAAEMEESGNTLDVLGLSGDLAREIAEIQRRQGAVDETQASGSLQDVVRAVLKMRLDQNLS